MTYISNTERTSNKGIPNGYASLDSTGNTQFSQAGSSIRFTNGTANYVGLTATPSTSNITLKLPNTLPSLAGQALVSDLLGNLSFATVSGGSALSNAYTSITDGTNTSTASGSDTFKFRSSLSELVFTVANNDLTHGDNIDITLATVAGLTATSYGSGSAIPVVSVDTKGRITAISTATIAPQNLTLTGTTGNGFITYPAQSSTPATPANGFTFFANNSNALSWKGANGFVRTFDGTSNTADRSYTLPNASGTLALLSQFVPAGSNTEVQYNNSGSFGSSANYTFDSTSGLMTLSYPTASTLTNDQLRLNNPTGGTSGALSFTIAGSNKARLTYDATSFNLVSNDIFRIRDLTLATDRFTVGSSTVGGVTITGVSNTQQLRVVANSASQTNDIFQVVTSSTTICAVGNAGLLYTRYTSPNTSLTTPVLIMDAATPGSGTAVSVMQFNAGGATRGRISVDNNSTLRLCASGSIFITDTAAGTTRTIIDGTGNISLNAASTSVRFTNGTANYVGLTASPGASNVIYTLPNTDGAANASLITNGAGQLSFASGTFRAYTSKTATYTITTSDSVVSCNGTFTVTLPTAVGNTGFVVTVKNTGTGTISIASVSNQTIDGVNATTTPRTLSTQYQALNFISNGTNWETI